MKKKLYYVISFELVTIGDIQETSGFKTITLYDVQNVGIITFGVINDVENSNSTIDAINDYLNDNGYGDETFEFKQL